MVRNLDLHKGREIDGKGINTRKIKSFFSLLIDLKKKKPLQRSNHLIHGQVRDHSVKHSKQV